MKYVIEVEMPELFDTFDDYQQHRILHGVFGVMHDAYGDMRTEMGNYGDVFSIYHDSEGWSEEDSTRAMEVTKQIEQRFEDQLSEEAGKNDF